MIVLFLSVRSVSFRFSFFVIAGEPIDFGIAGVLIEFESF